MSEPYGKFYAKTFTGSMRGAGSHVISLMAYAVANAKPPDGEVELNPEVAAFLIGETPERIQSALDYLCAPDAKSRTPTESGRRLIRVGEYKYRLVTWLAHREGTDVDAKRKYWRDKQQEYRENQKSTEAPKSQQKLTPSIRFQKPTHDDLTASGLSPLEAEKFINYYDSCGWVIGKNKPMKDWKSAARGWLGRSGQYQNNSSGTAEKELTDAEILKIAMQ